MCKHLFVNWFSIFFLLWALQKSALCSNGDHVLTSSFLNNHSSSGHLSLKHTPDFPIPASWPWLYWLYLLQQTGTITGLPRQWMKQVSPDMPAVYLGDSKGITVSSQILTLNQFAIEMSLTIKYEDFLFT